MTNNEERTRIIERQQDGTFTISFEGEQTEMLTLSAEELLDLAADLDVWRWRLTGDSYDPRVQVNIRAETMAESVKGIR